MNETGFYVAANGSLILNYGIYEDTGIYICYGVDNITGVNATWYYHITVREIGKQGSMTTVCNCTLSFNHKLIIMIEF